MVLSRVTSLFYSDLIIFDLNFERSGGLQLLSTIVIKIVTFFEGSSTFLYFLLFPIFDVLFSLLLLFLFLCHCWYYNEYTIYQLIEFWYSLSKMMRFFIVNDNFASINATEPIIMILQMLNNNKIMIKIDMWESLDNYLQSWQIFFTSQFAYW